jgi:hypothetical protein
LGEGAISGVSSCGIERLKGIQFLVKVSGHYTTSPGIKMTPSAERSHTVTASLLNVKKFMCRN